MPVVQFTDTEYELLPVGEYRIQVTNVVEEVGNFGPQLKLTLEIVKGEYEGKSLSAWCGLKGGPTAKLTAWAAALGLDTTPGNAIDTDDLNGKQCMATILVESKPGENGKLKEFNKVSALRAPRVKAKPAPNPEPVAAPADDDEDPFEGE